LFTGGISRTIPTFIAHSKSGVLYGEANSTEIRTVLDERQKFGFMAGIVIPKLQGVKINQFLMSPEETKKVIPI